MFVTITKVMVDIEEQSVIKILVISDLDDELDNIKQLLQHEPAQLMLAHGKHDAISQFQQYSPSLIVFAFSEIELAMDINEALHAQADEGQRSWFQTLLLCRGVESEKAYELCNAGRFDDYLADRPLQDLFRLRLSVNQALDRRIKNNHEYLLNRKIRKISDGLQSLKHFINGKLSMGEGQNRDAINIFRQFSQNLVDELDVLEKAVIGNRRLSDENVGEIKQKIQHIRTENIEGESARVVEKMEDSGKWIKEFEVKSEGMLNKIDSELSDGSRINILLVDDDDFYREILANMLMDDGMHVHGVDDGVEVLEALKRYKTDVILLDYQMPKMDGISTLIQIKEMSQYQAIPVIMLTGDGSREVVSGSISAGAADFIVKPCNLELLNKKISDVLNNDG